MVVTGAGNTVVVDVARRNCAGVCAVIGATFGLFGVRVWPKLRENIVRGRDVEATGSPRWASAAPPLMMYGPEGVRHVRPLVVRLFQHLRDSLGEDDHAAEHDGEAEHDVACAAVSLWVLAAAQ